MTDLKGLIERVEKATGPDEELSIDIWRALGGEVAGPHGYWSIVEGEPRSWPYEDVTSLTMSLDAALALVDKSILSDVSADIHVRSMAARKEGQGGGA